MPPGVVREVRDVTTGGPPFLASRRPSTLPGGMAPAPAIATTAPIARPG